MRTRREPPIPSPQRPPSAFALLAARWGCSEPTEPSDRITEPDWLQIEAPDIGRAVDGEALDARVDWMVR